MVPAVLNLTSTPKPLATSNALPASFAKPPAATTPPPTLPARSRHEVRPGCTGDTNSGIDGLFAEPKTGLIPQRSRENAGSAAIMQSDW
jgi:hypothetical protein